MWAVYSHCTVKRREGVSHKRSETFLLQKYLYTVFVTCKEPTELRGFARKKLWSTRSGFVFFSRSVEFQLMDLPELAEYSFSVGKINKMPKCY